TRPTASAGPQTSSDRDWINQLAAQLAGASSHHQPSAAASSLSSHLLGAMGDGRSATASFQQQTSSMPTEAELTSYLLNTVLGQQHQFHVSSQQQPAEQPQSNQQQSRVLALNSVYHPPSERPMHISSHQPSRNSQLFGGPFSGFGGQQLRQSNSTAETLNTAVPPPNMSFVPPPPFSHAQMPPPPNSW
uniref:Uncharacterized protein n=1 Tax=Plectus sambesii TaxID=2011161 RepID=A0A914V430_9BILA